MENGVDHSHAHKIPGGSKMMTIFHKDKKHDFDLESVLHSFQKCLNNDKTKTLMTEEYLAAYHELCRFFRLTGTLFGFVAKDLESKMKGIEYHLHSSHGQHYQTVQSMVSYEVKKGQTHVKAPHPSGTRLLQRLHYALEFILLFMKRVEEGDEHEKMSKLAWEVYQETLYHHHPWLTRKLSAVAVYALPSKVHLIKVMCKQDYAEVIKLLTEIVDAGQRIYDVTEEVLATHELQHIP